jgi:hypothetical protein
MPSLIGDVARDVKKDIKAAQKVRLPWWVVLGLVIGSMPIYLLFDRAGISTLGFPTLVSVIVVVFAVIVKWNLKQFVWFWITVTLLAALHVPLLLFVPWGTQWIPGPIAAVVGIVDLIVMLTVLDVVARLAKPARVSVNCAPHDRIGPSFKR